MSLTDFEAFGVMRGQSGFFEAFCGFFHIVFHATVAQDAIEVIVEEVTGPGIFVARLADTSDIHRVTVAVIQTDWFLRVFVADDLAGPLLPSHRRMGVPLKAHKRGLNGKVLFHLLHAVEIGKFSRLMQRGMNKHHGVKVCGNGKIAHPFHLGAAHLSGTRLPRTINHTIGALTPKNWAKACSATKFHQAAAV